MSKYFLIESRSPFDATEVTNKYQIAQDLAPAIFSPSSYHDHTFLNHYPQR